MRVLEVRNPGGFGRVLYYYYQRGENDRVMGMDLNGSIWGTAHTRLGDMELGWRNYSRIMYEEPNIPEPFCVLALKRAVNGWGRL